MLLVVFVTCFAYRARAGFFYAEIRKNVLLDYPKPIHNQANQKS